MPNFGRSPARKNIQEKPDRGAKTRRRILWMGFLAVLLPLLVLLGMQYWWLKDLESASRIAQQTLLEKTLDWAAQLVEVRYRKTSYLVLDIPPALLEQDEDAWLKHFSEEVPAERMAGYQRVFLLSFRKEPPWQPFFYDPKHRASADTAPISTYLSTLYWEKMALKGVAISVPRAIVDERDTENPIILHPVINPEGGALVGVTGAVVDVSYFRDVLLPDVIDEALRPAAEAGLSVTVWDAQGRSVYGEADLSPKKWALKRNFPFIFTDWTIGFPDLAATNSQLARANFAYNITISLILAGVVLAGMAWVLRLANRELMLSEMKSAFVSNVSHELRTPLASIRAFGELMRLGRVRNRERMRSYGEYIETESRRLSQLIDNILDFSKIESGQRVYHFEESRLEDVVGRVLRTFEVRLRNSKFRIAFQLPSPPLPPVSIDGDAIGHALGNLLDNAVKYSNGQTSIEVALTRDSGNLVLSVKDKGIGISPLEQKRIFERFHRVSDGLVHDVKGSGLGLAIVQHIVLAHGGTVTVQSTPGRGSCFSIHLPIPKRESSVGGPQ